VRAERRIETVSLGRISSIQRAFASLALAVSAAFIITTIPGAARRAAAFQSGAEYVKTFAADCVTPQTVFNPGDTVCAEAGDFPAPLSARYRRFQWAPPDGFVADLTNVKIDPQSDKFVIPASGALGTWTVATIDGDSNRFAVAKFTVRNPRFPAANLSVYKDGPKYVLPGDRVSYKLWINNPGPDFAEGVQIVDEVPTNMVFVALKQASGAALECSTPARGETGRSVCKVKGVPAEEPIELIAYYQVNPEAKEGETCSSSTEVTSATEELNKEDNFSTSEATVTTPAEETEPPPDNE
jgi:uncharacterized repeat protein (TIGR01451 family)